VAAVASGLAALFTDDPTAAASATAMLQLGLPLGRGIAAVRRVTDFAGMQTASHTQNFHRIGVRDDDWSARGARAGVAGSRRMGRVRRVGALRRRSDVDW
jgi:hypothetical protein